MHKHNVFLPPQLSSTPPTMRCVAGESLYVDGLSWASSEYFGIDFVIRIQGLGLDTFAARQSNLMSAHREASEFTLGVATSKLFIARGLVASRSSHFAFILNTSPRKQERK
eukprot:1170686-Amphidinium_carterae.1